MKTITYEEWDSRFKMKSQRDYDPAEFSEDERESLTFFDNGAVRNVDGDFIVKIDQVRRV